MELQTILALSALFLLVAAFLRKSKRQSSTLPLPPGPPPLPLLGNVLDIPAKNMPAVFRSMSAKYGDIVHLDMLGQPMIILGSQRAAIDLLEKRSANYSDRAPSVMSEATSFTWAFTLQGYGPWWRAHRKAFHQFFNPTAVLEYKPSQRLEAHRLVLRIINKPEDFLQHIRRLFGSAIMRLAYGVEVDEEETDFVRIAEDGMEVFSLVLEPGKFLVESFPILRFLPSWMPGARYKRDAGEWSKVVRRMVDVPWEHIKTAMKKGSVGPSMAATLLAQLGRFSGDGGQETEEEIVAKNATAVAYAGGSDTTLSTVQSFFLAIASYPEAQKKAQEELDAVVGPHRLPEFDDMESLPYMCALVKECLRWRSVVPLAVPHRSLEDDEYRGYRIPKGSIVIPNIWAISRDPNMYPDPETFIPDRFLKDGHLNPDVCDPATITFGYGRRICPGRHYAESSLFMIAASVLHTLSISAPLDGDGRRTHLEGKMTSGLLSYPEPFECVIKPRSPEAEALIRASCDVAFLTK